MSVPPLSPAPASDKESTRGTPNPTTLARWRWSLVQQRPTDALRATAETALQRLLASPNEPVLLAAVREALALGGAPQRRTSRYDLSRVSDEGLAALAAALGVPETDFAYSTSGVPSQNVCAQQPPAQ